jgi:hypothetical protein
MRRVLTRGITLPLVVAGSQLAHAAAYVFVTPDAHERARELAATGHGYFAAAPAVGGILGAVLVVALGLRVRSSVSGDRVTVVRAWPFALLPVIAFAVQEHLERLVHDGAFPLTAALEPTFALGLALQLPFGVLAYVVASLLLRAAVRLGSALRRRPPALPTPPAVVLRPRTTSPLLRPLLPAGCGVRGPPPAR